MVLHTSEYEASLFYKVNFQDTQDYIERPCLNLSLCISPFLSSMHWQSSLLLPLSLPSLQRAVTSVSSFSMPRHSFTDSWNLSFGSKAHSLLCFLKTFFITHKVVSKRSLLLNKAVFSSRN